MTCEQRFVSLIAMLLLVPPALSQSIETASWLVGCWESRSQGLTTIETWAQAHGNMMLATGQTVRGDSTIGFEFMTLGGAAGVMTYTAYPSGKQGTPFRAVTFTSEVARFENARHDFPRRIEYLRVGDDSLLASVFSSIEANAASFTIRYGRVSCSGN